MAASPSDFPKLFGMAQSVKQMLAVVSISARSHLIFTLTATQRDPEIGATLRGRRDR